MQNPFLTDKRYSIFYALAWIVTMTIHALVLWLGLDIAPAYAAADSLVFNFLFAGLGISIWYTIKFSSNPSGQTGQMFFNHALSGLVLVGIWLGAGYLALYFIIPDESYHLFLDQSVAWRVFIGVFFFAFMVLVYYLYMNAMDKQSRIRRENELKIQVREAEIDRIKAQINPHFLFNSLNSIAALIKFNPDDAREMVVKLSSYLRYSLEHQENQMTSLRNELNHIARYLEIEKARFGERLVFDLQVDEVCYDKTLPHMILQPLIENAIKHGVYESTEPVLIQLTAGCLAGNILKVEIANDFDPDSPPRKGKGIGIKNTMNRLKLVYNSDRLLDIVKSANRYQVIVSFPQNQDNE